MEEAEGVRPATTMRSGAFPPVVVEVEAEAGAEPSLSSIWARTSSTAT